MIIIGGYAVKQYYNDHQTSDIDIKVYPKNNYDVNDLMTKIIEKYTISKNFNPEEWKTKGRFIFDKDYSNNYNYIKTDNKLTISKYDSEYGYIPLIDIVFEKTKDKGSYTIIDGLKYRNKYYLINEILENTKDKDETFEERLDKAIEDHKQFLKLINDKKILENELEALKKELEDSKSEQQGGSYNPKAPEWNPNSNPNPEAKIKLIEEKIKSKEEQIKSKEEQIKDLKNSKENLYPDKVNSWIRQLENLRDPKVYTDLTEPKVKPTEQTTPGEGKVNLKVPLLKINQL